MSDEPKRIIDSAKRNASYAQLERLLPDIIREVELVARLRRASYDACIKQGFTPEQALVLCMKPGANP